MPFPITLPEPPDGWTQDEKVFLKLTVIQMYRSLNLTDKFILIATKDMGYPQEAVGIMLNLSQEVVSLRLKKICERLKLKGYDNDLSL